MHCISRVNSYLTLFLGHFCMESVPDLELLGLTLVSSNLLISDINILWVNKLLTVISMFQMSASNGYDKAFVTTGITSVVFISVKCICAKSNEKMSEK